MKTLLQFDSENGFSTVTPVAYGTQLIALMPTLKTGFIKWRDGQPVAQVMGLVGEGFRRPQRKHLDDDDPKLWKGDRDPWQPTNVMEFCQLHNTSVRLTFEVACSGNCNPLGPISIAYAGHRRKRPDDLPVVELYRSIDDDPAFEIVDWVNPHFIVGGLAKNIVTFPLRTK